MKKSSPLDILNAFGKAAHMKAQPPAVPGEDDDSSPASAPGAKSPKQVAAAKEKEKAKGKMCASNV